MISRRNILGSAAVAAAAGAASTTAQAAPGNGPRKGPPPHAGRGLIRSTIARMSIEEKVSQLFWTRAYGASADDTAYAAQNQADYGVDTPDQVVAKYHLGGVLYFAWAGNTDNPEQIANLSNGLQAGAAEQPSGVPLAITIDQEGGLVARVLKPATVFPGNMALGATESTDLSREQYRITGEELRAMGITVDFAPVADVNTNPENPVIGVRSFGEVPSEVAALTAAGVEGLQGAGTSATAKHFPGHGDTVTDSHFGLPTVTYGRDVLDQHLEPFRAAIGAGTDAIMTAHVIIQAIDPDLPSTLSPAVLTGLLREDMGYEGLIVTDSLDMEGVREEWGDDRVPVLSLLAGADVLLNPPLMDVAVQGVLDAVASGEVSEKRIEASVERILEMKLEQGLWDREPVDADGVMDRVGTEENLAVADEIAERAVTLVANDGGLLPLSTGTTPTLLVTGASGSRTEYLASRLEAAGFAVTSLPLSASPSSAERASAVAAAEAAGAVVLATNNAWRSAAEAALVADLDAASAPVVVVATRDAYDAALGGDAFLALYGSRDVAVDAAVRVLVGVVSPSGTLPVMVPAADGSVLFPEGHGLTF